MIILDATTKSLEIDLAGAVATTELPFVADYVDITTTAFTPGHNDGTTNGTTAVTLVAAPSASTQRQVKHINIYNVDTAAATVTIQYNNNSTLRTLFTFSLPVGYRLEYVDTVGWRVFDSTGYLLTTTAAAALTASQILEFQVFNN